MLSEPENHNTSGIIDDPKSITTKNQVMQSFKSKNIYDAVSKGAMYLGTMLTTATAGVILGGLLHGGGMAGLLATFTAPVIGALAIGVAVMAVGIAADYKGSYLGQSANFDVQEVSAKSTARGIRTELEDMTANMDVSIKPKSFSAAPLPQKNWAAQLEADKLVQTDHALHHR